MRKINGKLFLGLLIGGVVLTAGIFAVHHWQYQRIAHALLWQARHSEEEGQVRRMARYLQRYLEFNPRDYTVKANLAKAWTGEAFASNVRTRVRAVRLLDEVLTFEEDPALRRLLVKTALEVRDFKLARDQLTRLLSWPRMEEAIKDAANRQTRGEPATDEAVAVNEALGELECCWGQIAENETRTLDALGCYRLAVRHAPQNELSYVRLATLLRRTHETNPELRAKNNVEADQTMDALVKHNPVVAESHLARWRYRRDFDLMAIRETAYKGQIPLRDAAEDVARARKFKPESVEVLLAAADLERLLGRAAAENADLSIDQRRAELKKHREEAFQHLRRGLELVERNRGVTGENGEFQLLWHKGNLLMDDLEFQRAQAEEDDQPPPDVAKTTDEIHSVIQQVRKSRVPAAADYMQGRLLVHERRWAEAAAHFERARALMASQPDLACQSDLYLAQCYNRLEEHTQMYKAYQRVADWDPTSAPAQWGMGAARWAQNDPAQALTLFEGVVKQGRVPSRGWIDLSRLLIQLQAQSPAPDWTKAETALANAAKYNPKLQAEVALLRAEVLIRQNRLADAEKLIVQERDRATDKKAADLWVALADLQLRQKQPEKARALLDQARDKVGDQVSLRLAEARYYLMTKDARAKSKLGGLGEDREKFTEDDQARLLSGLADARMRAGDALEARKLWETLAGLPKQKHDLRLRLLLFDLAMKDGDEARLTQALDDIRMVEQSSGAYQRYGQALMLIWQARKLRTDAPAEREERAQKLQQARRELDQVLTVRPSWPPVFLARAEIAQMNGNQEQTINDLRQAVNSGERSSTVLCRLMKLLEDRKQTGEARTIRALAQREARMDPEMNRIMAGVALQSNDVSQALQYAHAAVRDDTKDPQELLWKARVLLLAKQPEEASKVFDKAIAFAGADPEPWVEKVQFLIAMKRRKEALALLAQAKTQLPADQAPLALGRCYDALGQGKEALQSYEKALQRKRTRATVKTVAIAHLAASRPVEAEPLLREIAEGKIEGGTAEDVVWAQRSLAMVLASGTDYQRFAEALRLVGLKLDAHGRLLREEGTDENTLSRRAKARVLASQQGQRQFRQKAIEMLEELARQNELTDDDKFILALLLDAEGRARDSELQLSDLVQEKTRTPRYLAQYAMNLLVHRRTPDYKEKARQAIEWLKDLEKAREVGPNGFASVELEARWREVNNEGDQAIDLLEQHAFRKGARPEEVLLVLAALSRQRKYAKAFALCEKTWKEGKCMPEVIGGVSVSLLRVMDASDVSIEAVEKHLRAAIDQKPASSVLKMHLADLYDKRGQYDKSAQLYRQIMKGEPSNVVALNNLAWLLATRNGDGDEALKFIDVAVNGMGRRADLLDTRGLVHLKLKNTTQAVEDLVEATTEAPTAARLFHLARAYHEDRNPAKAREALKQAKAKGLEVAQMHPIEQKICQDLLAEYQMR